MSNKKKFLWLGVAVDGNDVYGNVHGFGRGKVLGQLAGAHAELARAETTISADRHPYWYLPVLHELREKETKKVNTLYACVLFADGSRIPTNSMFPGAIKRFERDATEFNKVAATV